MGACVTCGRGVYDIGGDCLPCRHWLINVHLWLARTRYRFLFADSHL